MPSALGSNIPKTRTFVKKQSQIITDDQGQQKLFLPVPFLDKAGGLYFSRYGVIKGDTRSCLEQFRLFQAVHDLIR